MSQLNNHCNSIHIQRQDLPFKHMNISSPPINVSSRLDTLYYLICFIWLKTFVSSRLISIAPFAQEQPSDLFYAYILIDVLQKPVVSVWSSSDRSSPRSHSLAVQLYAGKSVHLTPLSPPPAPPCCPWLAPQWALGRHQINCLLCSFWTSAHVPAALERRGASRTLSS